jgi:hypothetical protein
VVKRHMTTPALRLLFCVLIVPANDSDGQCLPDLPQRLLRKVRCLKPSSSQLFCVKRSSCQAG